MCSLSWFAMRGSWFRSRFWLVVVAGGVLQAGATIPFSLASGHQWAIGLTATLVALIGVLVGVSVGALAASIVAVAGWLCFAFAVTDDLAAAAPVLPAVVAAAIAAGIVAERLRRTDRERGSLRHRLAAIDEASGDAIIETQEDGSIAGWNRAAERIYGYTSQEALGSPATLLSEGAAEQVASLLEPGDHPVARAPETVVHRRKDGSPVTVTMSAFRLSGEGGELGAAWLVVSDQSTEQKLRNVEARQRGLIEQLPLVTYVQELGGDEQAMAVSPQIKSLLGYTPEEWLAEPELFARLVHPDDRERVLAERARFSAEGQRLRSEYRMLTRDGRTVWVRDEAATVRDAQGRPACVQGHLLDLSEQHAAAAEREQLASEGEDARTHARLVEQQLALQAEIDEILVSSHDHSLTLPRAAQRLVRSLADVCAIDLGYEQESLRRLTVAEAEPAEGAARQLSSENVRSRVLEVARDGRLQSAPATGTSPAERGALSALHVPLLVRDRVLGVLTLLRFRNPPFTQDEIALVQRIAWRAALVVDNGRLLDELEQRAESARVLAHVADGVFLVDGSGIVRSWNQAAAALTGLAAEEVVGRPAAEAISGWDDLLERIPVGDKPEALEQATVSFRTGNGDRWLSIAGIEFYGGTVYAFRDVTETRRLEELRADFVATASHELRTPLAAVYGAALTLRRHDFALDESGRERFISMIVEEAERLTRIVNEILLANQLDAGRLDLRTETFDPVELAERVIETMRPQLPAETTLEISAPSTPYRVLADRDKLQQVLINLLENASKYSLHGGHVELTLTADERTVRFSVRDEGLGVPARERERIFEKFYRLDPDLLRGVGGSGLGLYICRELINQMNGRIWAEANDGAGSTFTVELPAAEPLSTHPLARSEGAAHARAAR